MRTACLAAWLALAAPATHAANEALELFVRPEKGHCIACHQLPPGAGPATRSDVGPKLEGSRMRALGREGIREVLVDPMRRNPDTVMPPFGRHHVLDAREIERLTEFLHALP